jgi:predicted outer membrane protein
VDGYTEIYAQAPAPGQALPAGWVATEWGPLGPADRDFLVKVRLAGLWEMPAGEMAQERSDNALVREVGRTIADQHAALDEQVRAVSARLNVVLPDKPSDQQQGWLDEMAQLRGDAFDRAYAQLLRDAHGKVFSVIAVVRAGTRNELVRDFAEAGNKAVLTHMQLLESTSFVDYGALAPPPDPPLAAVAAQGGGVPGVPASNGVDSSIVWIVLGIALVAGLATTARVIRPR